MHHPDDGNERENKHMLNLVVNIIINEKLLILNFCCGKTQAVNCPQIVDNSSNISVLGSNCFH